MHLLEDYIPYQSFAASLGRSERTIYRWMNRPNGLPYTEVGGLRLLHMPTVEKWLLGNMRANTTRRAKGGKVA